MPSIRITGDDLDAELLPERALYLHPARALLVADIHAQRGSERLSDGFDEESLVRLSRAAMRMQAKVIVLLGAFVDSGSPLSDEQMQRFAEFRERCSIPIRLLEPASMRRAVPLPPEWCVDRVREPFDIAGVRCACVQTDAADGWTVVGSTHPSAIVRQGGAEHEVPAFVVHRARRTLALPAFSKHTRHVRVAPSTEVELYAIHSLAVTCVHGGAS